MLEINYDYVPQQFRQNCERIIPYLERVQDAEWYDSFIYLKTEFQSVGFYNLSLNELFYLKDVGISNNIHIYIYIYICIYVYIYLVIYTNI